MFLLTAARCLLHEPVQVEMPKSNLVIDPRPNNRQGCKFEFVYHENGTTVTLIRISGGIYVKRFDFRVYDPTIEAVPNFKSTTYFYMGVDGEHVPEETTLLLIDPSVQIIKERAFASRNKVKKCIMHNFVHTIENYAFCGCWDMQVIKLSRTLKRIGSQAFLNCESLDAIFLPHSIREINSYAFMLCDNIRILSIPPNANIQPNGNIIYGCETFFESTRIQDYQRLRRKHNSNNEIHQAILQFYQNLSPMHKVCLDTNVSSQSIKECIDTNGPGTVSIIDHDGMTPLHILSMNPHADTGSILTCFYENMNVAFVSDSRSNTPLDYLRIYHIEAHTVVIAALCMARQDNTRLDDDI
mmetsp:Transcript_9661/g.11184  ORF Transcript_9661/g.11184 Transcript_9661/m.11184 type:complete len:355 (+) Transcript_9661:121-1185(+)